MKISSITILLEINFHLYLCLLYLKDCALGQLCWQITRKTNGQHVKCSTVVYNTANHNNITANLIIYVCLHVNLVFTAIAVLRGLLRPV